MELSLKILANATEFKISPQQRIAGLTSRTINIKPLLVGMEMLLKNKSLTTTAKDATISGKKLNIPCYPHIVAKFKHGILNRRKEIEQKCKNEYIPIHPYLPK